MAAEALAGQALALMEQSLPSGFYLLEAYSAVVEVYLARWESRSELPPRERRECSRRLYRALRVLGQYATMFAIGRPRAWQLFGRFAAQTPLPWLAHAAWLGGLRAAERLGMPYEEARLCYEIGRHATGARRAQHLGRAIHIFGRLGAHADEADARQAARR